jgi:hypothetical protein
VDRPHRWVADLQVGHEDVGAAVELDHVRLEEVAGAELPLCDRHVVDGHPLQPVPVRAALGVEAEPRPVLRVAVDGARAGDRHIGLVDRVDERRVVVALDALPPGEDRRQERCGVRLEPDGRAGCHVQVHVGEQVDLAGAELAAGDQDPPSARGVAGRDGLPEGGGAVGGVVAHRAVVADVEAAVGEGRRHDPAEDDGHLVPRRGRGVRDPLVDEGGPAPERQPAHDEPAGLEEVPSRTITDHRCLPDAT